jgi:hypothetical protein
LDSLLFYGKFLKSIFGLLKVRENVGGGGIGIQKWACRVCKGLCEYSGDEGNVHIPCLLCWIG